RGGEADLEVVGARRRHRFAHARHQRVDAEKLHLRDAELAETHIGGADAAPDVEDAFARARLERLTKELGKLRVPPALAKVLERRGGQGVDVAGHAVGQAVTCARQYSNPTRVAELAFAGMPRYSASGVSR